MSVKIRLKRMGKIRQPFYRIVVADARAKRDGRVIEEIGTYNPMPNPSHIEVSSDRAQYWLSVGAQPTEPVLALLKLTGDWGKFKGEGPTESQVQAPAEKVAYVKDENKKPVLLPKAEPTLSTAPAEDAKAEDAAEAPADAAEATEPAAESAE